MPVAMLSSETTSYCDSGMASIVICPPTLFEVWIEHRGGRFRLLFCCGILPLFDGPAPAEADTPEARRPDVGVGREGDEVGAVEEVFEIQDGAQFLCKVPLRTELQCCVAG